MNKSQNQIYLIYLIFSLRACRRASAVVTSDNRSCRDATYTPAGDGVVEREAPQAFLEQCETGVSHCLQRALSSGVVNLAPMTDGTVAVGRFLLGEKLPNRVLRPPTQHCGDSRVCVCACASVRGWRPEVYKGVQVWVDVPRRV